MKMISSFSPKIDKVIGVDVPRYRKLLLQNLNTEGTYFLNSMGTFYIKISSHNPEAAMKRLRKSIENATLILEFEYGSPNIAICEYSVIDELYDKYSDCSIIEYCQGDSLWVVIHFYDSVKSPIYFKRDGNVLNLRSKDEFNKFRKKRYYQL